MDPLSRSELTTVPYQVLIHPDSPQPNLASESVAVAMQLQLDLLGAGGAADAIDSPHAFLPLKKHRGLCRACGARTDMSFEHMPPAASGNTSRARGANSFSILTSADPSDFPRSGWFPSQKGMGAFVLCRPCNELFGRKYINAYIAFADGIGLGAINAIRERGFIPGTVNVDLQGWELGDIAREGLVQLLDLGVHDRLIRRFPTLSSVVLTGVGGLPPELRLGLTLILNTAKGRVCSPMLSVIDADKSTETVTLFSEVAMAPFAWTLSFTANGRQPLARTADVSHWLQLGHSETAAAMPLELPVGTIDSAVPGDYSFGDVVHAS